MLSATIREDETCPRLCGLLERRSYGATITAAGFPGKEQNQKTEQYPNQPAHNGKPPSVLWDSRKRIAASVSWVHWSCEFLRKRGAISEIRKSLPVRGPRWRRPYCTMIVPVIMG